MKRFIPTLKAIVLACAVLVVTAGLTSQASAADALKLGVLAKRGVEQAKEQWQPLVDYLSKTTGLSVGLVPLSFEAIEPAISGKKIDYLIANSGYFAQMQPKYNVAALASMMNMAPGGKSLNQFGGVIFVKSDSAINSVADMKGKKFMCVKKDSFGGGQMAFKQMFDKGVNPFKDTTLIEGKTHDAVVVSVQKGIVDCGTVRSDTLERMEAEGKIKISSFKIIDQVKDDFPFVHSTILYPEWPFAALSHTTKDNNDKIKAALTAITPDMPAAKSGKFTGWSDPLDYKPVAECLATVAKAEK